MNGLKKVLLISTFAFLISNCASTKSKINIEFDSVKPAKFNLKSFNISKVYIMPFSVSESKNLLFYRKYDNNYSIDKNSISDKINNRNLQRMLNALNISEISLSDSNFVKKLIKDYSLDAVVVGKITYKLYDKVNRRDDSKEINNQYIKYKSAQIERLLDMNVDFNLIDLKTKKVVFSSSQSCSRNKSTSYYPELINNINQESFKNSNLTFYSLEEIANKLDNSSYSINGCINDSANGIEKQLFPYQLTEVRGIRGGNSIKMQEALKFIKKNKWEEAVKNWQDVLSAPENIEESEDANFNLGIYYESIDELEQAKKYFLNSYNISNKDAYLNAMARIDERKEELKRLIEQGYYKK